MAYVEKSGLKVDQLLVDFVEQEAIPGTSVSPAQFWDGFAGLVREGPLCWPVRLLRCEAKAVPSSARPARRRFRLNRSCAARVELARSIIGSG